MDKVNFCSMCEQTTSNTLFSVSNVHICLDCKEHGIIHTLKCDDGLMPFMISYKCISNKNYTSINCGGECEFCGHDDRVVALCSNHEECGISRYCKRCDVLICETVKPGYKGNDCCHFEYNLSTNTFTELFDIKPAK